MCLSGTKRKADTAMVAAGYFPQPAVDKWTCSLCQVSTTSRQGLEQHFQGKTHKAREQIFTSGKLTVQNSGGSTSMMNAVKKSWTCSLCLVSATCEKGLEQHYQGKMHKARQELVNASKLSAQNFSGSISAIEDSAKESWTCSLCKVNASSRESLLQHLRGKKHKFQVEFLEEDYVKAKTFNCSICEVECNSQAMLDSHLIGKPHKSRVGKAEEEIKSVTTTEHVTRGAIEETNN